MRGIVGVCLALAMIARLAVCLRGGRPMRSGEFPFLVRITKYNYTWCIGSIVSNVRIIFPDDCLRKSPLIGFASANVIPIVNQAPPKKYTGWFVQTDYSDTYTELDVISILLDPPGLELAEWGDQDVNLPKRTLFSHQTPEISDVIVVGLNGRVGAMTILDDFECFNRIGDLYFPINDRLQSIKVLLGNKLMCAVVKNTTRPVVDVPLGEACERDLGAPVIQDGAVVGMVVRSFCLQSFPHVVLISRLTTRLEPNPSQSVLNVSELKRQTPIIEYVKLERAVKVESSVNTRKPESVEVSHEEASTKPLLVNGEDSVRLRRRDMRNETESEIPCHDCEEPAVKDGASVSNIEVSPEAPLTNGELSGEGDKINDATARRPSYGPSCKDIVSKPRVSQGANTGRQSFDTELVEQNSTDMKIRVGNKKNRVQPTDGMNVFDDVESNIVVTKKQKREGKKVIMPIQKEKFSEKVVRDVNPLRRRRREASSPQNAGATNATIPGGNMTVNATSPVNMNGTEKTNETVAMVNSTGSEVNVTGSMTNTSLVMGDAIAGNDTVNATLAPSTVIHGVHSDNETGGSKIVKKHDNKTEEVKGGVGNGIGEGNETEELILSGGDFDAGLEHLGGTGNDTSGSGNADVISGFGESVTDEVHESEEKLGPAERPRPSSVSTSERMTTETPAPNTPEREDDHVGPPEPNDDRPDYQAKPPRAQIRHASFSPEITPSCFLSLGSFIFILMNLFLSYYH